MTSPTAPPRTGLHADQVLAIAMRLIDPHVVIEAAAAASLSRGLAGTTGNPARPATADSAQWSRHDEVTGAARLHPDLAELLRAQNVIRTAPVDAAMTAVPRHLFLPGVPHETAYAPDDAVVTTWNADGTALSSASAPRVVVRCPVVHGPRPDRV